MRGLIKAGTEFYTILILVLTVVMFCVVGTNVFSRYVLNSSLGWADELARFMFIWLSFLGAVLAYAHNEHVGLDFLVDRISSKKLQLVFRLLGDLGILIVALFLTYYGWLVATSATNVSPALYIPMKYVYLIVPISAALIVMINLHKIWQHINLLQAELSVKA